MGEREREREREKRERRTKGCERRKILSNDLIKLSQVVPILKKIIISKNKEKNKDFFVCVKFASGCWELLGQYYMQKYTLCLIFYRNNFGTVKDFTQTKTRQNKP